jgi:hypothetical protein
MTVERLLFLCLGFVLFSACGGNTPAANTAAADSSQVSGAPFVPLSDKIFAIAEALPIKSGEADSFFSKLFSADDSLYVTKMHNNYTNYFGKNFSIHIADEGGEIKDAQIMPPDNALIQLPLKEMATKMDSAWKEPINGPVQMKEPPPAITANYTDKQKRTKTIRITGPHFDTMEENENKATIRTIQIRLHEHP